MLSAWFRKCLTAAGLSLAGAALLAAPAAAQLCIPEFPFQQGWLGADAAYSIPLPDGRSVWIFGDTLYGARRVVQDKHPVMTRNSIGISTCDAAGRFRIDYFIRGLDRGQPADFFPPLAPGYWYWALDGFYHQGALWVAMLRIRDVEITDPKEQVFTFEVFGTDLARVTGLDAPPADWKVEVFPLVEEGTKAYPSATVVREGDFVYLFALYEAGSRPMVLARIPLAGLDAPRQNLQYLARDGSWKPGFRPADARVVMKRGASEMSVRFHPPSRRWLAVLVHPTLGSDRVLLRTAPRLEGPWSEGRVIYRIPELDRRKPGYDPDTFCYAGKEHAQFRQPGKIVFTYVCNTFAVKKLETLTHIYVPRAVVAAAPR